MADKKAKPAKRGAPRPPFESEVKATDESVSEAVAKFDAQSDEKIRLNGERTYGGFDLRLSALSMSCDISNSSVRDEELAVIMERAETFYRFLLTGADPTKENA